MIKYYDTHIHIPSPSKEGLDSFLKYVNERPQLLGGLLILNDQQDVDFAAKNLQKIPEGFIPVPYYNYLEKDYPNAVTSSGWLKVHPVLSKLSNNEIDKFIEFIKEKRRGIKGLIVHCFPWGLNMEYNFSLKLVLEIARQLPELYILIAHGGGYESWQFRAHTGSLKNVFYDFSVTLKYYQGSDLLRPFQRYLLHSSDRIFFGSDFPIATDTEQMHEALRLANEVGVDDKKLESLFINNFLKIWGHLLKI